MEDQIRARLAQVREGFEASKLTISRTLETDQGTFTVSMEVSPVKNPAFPEEDIPLTLCLAALATEKAVIRQAFIAGALTPDQASDRMQVLRQAFIHTAAQLTSLGLSSVEVF